MNRAATSQPVVWNADRIREELRRRHLTLTGVARAAGLPEDACRKAMYGYSRKGADALAEALDIPFDTLFPEGFVQSRRQASVKALAESRQKRVSTADKVAARG